MQPAARIQSLIELVEEIEAAIETGTTPVDVLVGNYFRARRYAGSKDRRYITQAAYSILRQRVSLLWYLNKTKTERSARPIVIAYLALNDLDALSLFAEEGAYAPDSLTDIEIAFVAAVQAQDIADVPLAAQHNIPDWAIAGFEARYGDTWPKAALALNQQATVDLRINSLKSKSAARESFHGKTVPLENTPFSPMGLRSLKNVALGGIDDFKRGLLEVQDEAAQIASLLVGAEPGMQVADFCAGAGGKSLTIAAQMENKGQIYAFDISAKRLDSCKKRAQRSGARNIQVSQLPKEGEKREAKLASLAGLCDRVFVDAPCSGSGTWRRSPDQRWRQNTSGISKLTKIQLELLNEASGLVRKGGRLIYMTCSVFPAENEEIVTRFLKDSVGWKLVNYKSVWSATVDTKAPETRALIPETLQLSPETHQTDGFFIAIFELNA